MLARQEESFDPYTEICRIAHAVRSRRAADCCRSAADFAHDAWLRLATSRKDLSKLTREQLRDGVCVVIWNGARACPKHRDHHRDMDQLPAAGCRDDLLAVEEPQRDEGQPLKRAARAMRVTEQVARSYWLRARTRLRLMLGDPSLPAHA